jgi:hypothetical protein
MAQLVPEYTVFANIQACLTPCCLGPVVVSVLATGPKGRRFKPGRGDDL